MLHRLRHSRPVGVLRYHLYRDLLLAFPRRRTCNICSWRGRRFLTFRHRYVLCPQCGSQIRHRLIQAAIARLPVGARTPVDGARVLHISPEHCVGLVFRARARRYVRADYSTADCDVRQDATKMPFRSGAFDTVICCDTLEHIPDDRSAIAEIHRVLRAGGVAILTVPQSDTGVETYEDPRIVTSDDRDREYGQWDHVRNYGSDFEARLAAAGFTVSCIGAEAFDADTIARHVLKPPVPLTESWGWNNRRIYFAQKPSAP